MGLSTLSSVLTLFLLCASEPPAILTDQIRHITRMLFLLTASGVAFLLPIAGFIVFGPLFPLRDPIPLEVIRHLLQNLLVAVSEVTFATGVLSLIGTAILYTSVRLYTRCTSPMTAV